MAEKDQNGPDVDQFLRDHIDTVPHLEALLLLWNSRPKEWSVEEMAKGLFLPPEAAKEILEDLTPPTSDCPHFRILRSLPLRAAARRG